MNNRLKLLWALGIAAGAVMSVLPPASSVYACGDDGYEFASPAPALAKSAAGGIAPGAVDAMSISLEVTRAPSMARGCGPFRSVPACERPSGLEIRFAPVKDPDSAPEEIYYQVKLAGNGVAKLVEESLFRESGDTAMVGVFRAAEGDLIRLRYIGSIESGKGLRVSLQAVDAQGNWGPESPEVVLGGGN